jgi:PAS domain S-box-containing protein
LRFPDWSLLKLNFEPLPEDVQNVVNDNQRLLALGSNIDRTTENIEELDIITSMLVDEFEVKIALVSLVYDDVQWFQSCQGLTNKETPVGQSFCAHAITAESSEPFIVLDASKDERFADNPLVTDEPNIRLYIGVPIIVDMQKIGTLCVIDDKPHTEIDAKSIEHLKQYAKLIGKIISFRTDAKLKLISEQKHMNEIKRHRLALKASNVAAWVWDLESDYVDCDPELRELFGVTHLEPIKAAEIFSQIHPDDVKEVEGQMHSVLITDADFKAEFRIPSNNKWLMGQGSVLSRDVDGKAQTIAGVNIDITEQKHSEEKTNLLLRELNHRVKNTLAMLQSIANQTLKNSRTPEEFKKAFSGRIRSLAAAHTLLSDKEWEPINLYKLLRDQVNVYVDDIDKQLVIEGDEATLGPEEALALGMVLHELATNAAKYGAISIANGYIQIITKTSKVEGEDFLTLNWKEINGPTVTPPQTTGFGSIMIKRSLDKIVGSKVHLEYLPEGVEAKIELPLINRYQTF